MAAYRLELIHIQRSAGRSAVAAAAYRARTRLFDERQGISFSYAVKKSERYVEGFIVAPYAWAEDRSTLWNTAEFAERRKDARPAAEVLVNIPRELTDAQGIELVRTFIEREFVEKRGLAVDANLHESVGLTGLKNFHAHLLLTTRMVCLDGLAALKDREFTDKGGGALALVELRKAWAEDCNNALQAAGHTARVDHRSRADRAKEARENDDEIGLMVLDCPPEPKIGPVATAMIREGRGADAHAWTDVQEIREERAARENIAGEMLAVQVERALLEAAKAFADLVRRAFDRARELHRKSLSAAKRAAADLAQLIALPVTPRREPTPDPERDASFAALIEYIEGPDSPAPVVLDDRFVIDVDKLKDSEWSIAANSWGDEPAIVAAIQQRAAPDVLRKLDEQLGGREALLMPAERACLATPTLSSEYIGQLEWLVSALVV